MKHTFLFILLFGFIYIAQGQITKDDRMLRHKADKYLYSQLGKKFTRKYLKFLFIKESGISVAVYEAKGKKRADGKNTLLVYFQYNGKNIDSSRIIFNQGEILKCIIGEECNMFIGLDRAKEIAKLSGLPDGDRPWEISLTDLGNNQIPKWGITSTRYNNNDGHGSGWWAGVNMMDGSFESGLWSSTP